MSHPGKSAPAGNRTNHKRGTASKVRLGNFRLRHRNRNNQKFDIFKKKQRRMRPGLGRKTSKELKKEGKRCCWFERLLGRAHADTFVPWPVEVQSSVCFRESGSISEAEKGWFIFFNPTLSFISPFCFPVKASNITLRKMSGYCLVLTSSWGSCLKETFKENGCWDDTESGRLLRGNASESGHPGEKWFSQQIGLRTH